MHAVLIWDFPTRFFHWAFACSLSLAMAIGFLADKHSPRFQWHMLFGMVALFLVVVRLLMGVVGSRHARFSSYPLRPREVVSYFVSALFSKTRRYVGNNPGSALAAVLMFSLVPLLFASGIGLGGEAMEDIHESLAWGLLLVVALHLVGIFWHTLRHRDGLALSMLHGKKPADPTCAIRSPHLFAGAILLVATCAWTLALFANHDRATSTVKLPIFGTTLKLGGNDHAGPTRRHSHHQKRHHHDDD